MIKFLIILAALTGKVYGAEVPVISPDEFVVSPAAHWIWAVLASPVAVGVLTWIGTHVDKWFRERNTFKRKEAFLSLYECAAAGVEMAYVNYVRRIKHATDGGKKKLEEGQKRTAMEMGIREMQAYAKANGIKAIKEATPEIMTMIIEQVIANRKKGKFIPDPFSDSSSFQELEPIPERSALTNAVSG